MGNKETSNLNIEIVPKEPCEYCNGKPLLHIKEDDNLYREFWGTYEEKCIEIDIRIRCGKLLEAIPSEESCFDACRDIKEINYCPMCGRRLEDKNWRI